MSQVIPFNRSRVDLHSDFIARREINNRLKSIAKLAELLTVEMGGSAPAKMDLLYMKRLVDFSAELLQVVNLLQKMVEKELNLGTVIGNVEITQAIKTHLFAEGDMQIQMQGPPAPEKLSE